MSSQENEQIKAILYAEKISDIEKICENIGYNFEEPPFNPPDSVIEALIARQLALKIDNCENNAQWQNYWFSCCISGKCDYLFNLIAKYKNFNFKKIKDINPCIDREEDIKKLLEENSILLKNVEIKGMEKEEHGKKAYLNLCIKFLLKRYALMSALKLWWKHKNPFVFVNFLLPRLLGVIVLGLLFLFTEVNIKNFVMNMSVGQYLAATSLFIVISFLYMSYECYNVVEERVLKSIGRALVMTVFGLLMSLFLIKIFFIFMIGIPEKIEVPRPELLYVSAALFIGILSAIFFEDKTIAEPLKGIGVK